MNRTRIILPCLLLFAVFIGCGPDRRLSQAKSLEKKGRYQEAWERYQEFSAKYPKHPAAAEGLFRAGWLAQKRLGDCIAAKAFYESVVQRYPQSTPWASQAAYLKSNCPDYFPLIKGFRWVEGDSETRGHNARIEVTCKTPSGNNAENFTGLLEKTFFAGDTKFKTIRLPYKKTDQELFEFENDQDPRSKTILMWPLEVGLKWATKLGGKIFRYEITAVDKTVKVVAGEFTNCVQVRSSIEGYAGTTIEYYAPDVGRVLVSYATSDGEKRNTELISYEAVEIDLPEKKEVPAS